MSLDSIEQVCEIWSESSSFSLQGRVFAQKYLFLAIWGHLGERGQNLPFLGEIGVGAFCEYKEGVGSMWGEQ